MRHADEIGKARQDLYELQQELYRQVEEVELAQSLLDEMLTISVSDTDLQDIAMDYAENCESDKEERDRFMAIAEWLNGTNDMPPVAHWRKQNT